MPGDELEHAPTALATADARTRGLAVPPFCPYVRKVIADNPDAYVELDHRRPACKVAD